MHDSMTWSFLFFGVAIFLFSLRWPKYAIFLPLITHPLYLVRGMVGFVPTTLLEIILVSVVVGVGVRYIPHISARALLQRRLEILSIVVFLISATISAAIAPHPETAWGVWKAMVIQPALYALVLVYVVHRERLQRFLVISFVVGGIGAALASFIAVILTSEAWEHPLMRLSGIYDVPNSLALIMAPMFAVSVVVLMRRWSPWMFISAVMFGGVLLATQSLAGLIASGGAICIMCGCKQRKIFFVICVVIFFGIASQVFTGKLSSTALRMDSSSTARVQIWQTSVLLIREHPFWGTGLGTFEPAYQNKLRQILETCPDKIPCLVPGSRTATLPLEWVVRDPHNIVLSFWLNTGLAGLVSMGALVSIAFTRLILHNTKNFHITLLGAAFLTLLLFGIVDVPYWKNDVAILWWVVLVCLLQLRFSQVTRELRADRV